MAAEIAKRSLCTRDRVGAIVTDKQNKVIGEGYNGPPSGFWHAHQPCTKWCSRAAYAEWLKAPGAPDMPRVAEAGQRGPEPDYRDCPSLHAEANALIISDRTLRAGGTIFVTSHVCVSCAKLIANSGLRYVVVSSSAEQTHRRSDKSYDFLEKCGLTVYVNDERWVKQ